MIMFRDSSDISVKRVIAFLGFMFFGIAMLLGCFNKTKVELDVNLIDAIKMIVLVCIGGNVIEKFKSLTNKSE